MGRHNRHSCSSGSSSTFPTPHPASIPNAKWSTITGLVAQPSTWSSYPHIQRCKIHDCVFTNPSTADYLKRSDLHSCTLRSEKEKERVNIKWSTLKHTVVHNSVLKRAILINSNLSNVGYGKRLKGQNARLDQVKYLKHTNVVDSSVSQSNTIKWSDLKNSDVVRAWRFKRAKLQRTRVVNSQILRSTLEDCQVQDAIIDRCTFKGLVLENGIWKNGNLIGRTNDREVIVRSIDEAGTVPSANYSQGQVINIRTRDVPIMNPKQFGPDSDSETVSSLSDVDDDDDRDEAPVPVSIPVETHKKDDRAPPPYQA